MAGARENAQSSPVENYQISKSGSGRRKGSRIDKLLVGGSTVQFDKIDQHQPVPARRAVQSAPVVWPSHPTTEPRRTWPLPGRPSAIARGKAHAPRAGDEPRTRAGPGYSIPHLEKTIWSAYWLDRCFTCVWWGPHILQEQADLKEVHNKIAHASLREPLANAENEWQWNCELERLGLSSVRAMFADRDANHPAKRAIIFDIPTGFVRDRLAFQDRRIARRQLAWRLLSRWVLSQQSARCWVRCAPRADIGQTMRVHRIGVLPQNAHGSQHAAIEQDMAYSVSGADQARRPMWVKSRMGAVAWAIRQRPVSHPTTWDQVTKSEEESVHLAKAVLVALRKPGYSVTKVEDQNVLKP